VTAEPVYTADERSLEPWQQGQLASGRRWGCLCAGEEQRGDRGMAWRHSRACPVRGPGWAMPAHAIAYGILPEPEPEQSSGSKQDKQQAALRLHQDGMNWRQVGAALGISSQLARWRGMRAAERAGAEQPAG
jgi:hypothetical protein